MDLFNAAPGPGIAQIARIKDWVRDRFALGDDVVVMVTELRCSEPGCPPLETVIAILDGPGSKRQYKLHKGTAEVVRQDIIALLQ